MIKSTPVTKIWVLSGLFFLSSCSLLGDSEERAGCYKVVKGDTLFGIAFRYGMDYRALAKANNIEPPYKILIGQCVYVGSSTPPVKADSKSGAAATQKSESVQPVSSSVRWRWPLEGRILSGFNGQNGLNKGVDIVGKLGQPVVAAASGSVVYAGNGLLGYGELVIIKHNDEYLSAYGHNSRLLVREGDKVTAGQKIAEVGSSGTDRPKLHFEIRKDGKPVDPVRYLPKR